MKMNTALIGSRNTGKTTKLFDFFKENVGRKIVVDSATDHVSKSLIHKINNLELKKTCYIGECDEREILFPIDKKDSYPYNKVSGLNPEVFLCDTSFFLEKGYETNVAEEREKCRSLYKRLSMQNIKVIAHHFPIKYVIMDEVELTPKSEKVIREINSHSGQFVIALHTIEGLGGLDKLFRIIRL